MEAKAPTTVIINGLVHQVLYKDSGIYLNLETSQQGWLHFNKFTIPSKRQIVAQLWFGQSVGNNTIAKETK